MAYGDIAELQRAAAEATDKAEPGYFTQLRAQVQELLAENRQLRQQVEQMERSTIDVLALMDKGRNGTAATMPRQPY